MGLKKKKWYGGSYWACKRWCLVGGMCCLLPYSTSICHHTLMIWFFLFCLFVVLVHSIVIFVLSSDKQNKCWCQHVLAVYVFLTRAVLKGLTHGTFVSTCMFRVMDCVWIHFVELTQAWCEQFSDGYLLLTQLILGWSCVWLVAR